ncbi:MAG: hypothetical protein ACLGIT_08155 [Gammaproteobacteria bacterium]
MTEHHPPAPPRRGLSRRQTLSLLGAVGLGGEALAQANDRAKGATQANPASYKVLLENERVRVLEYRSRPSMGVCGEGLHSHPDHVTISLAPAKARLAGADGKAHVVDIPPGFVLWEDAGTHATENIGGFNAHLVIVELKGPGWAPSTG